MSGTAQLQLRQGDVLAKKYEVDALLGSGPTGATWSARRLSDGARVALKLLSGPPTDGGGAQEIFGKLRGATADALVPVVDLGEHLGHRYLVSELVEGESLRRLMDSYAGQKRPFTLQEACQIAVRLLEAAESAHNAGLVHRYIKPSAVIVHTRTVGPGHGKAVRTVKLSGLGEGDMIAPAVLAENLHESLDARYIAPELSTGGTPNARSDIYSVGVILYELLCGQTPQGSYLSPSQVRDDLPRHIDGIVDIALGANPEDRYPTARDMINDIQRTFTEDDKTMTEVPKRTYGLVVAAALGLVAIVAAALFLNDPEAAAARADAELRAKVVKGNTLPSAAEIQKKLEGHPGMQYIPAGSFIRGRMNAESGAVAQPTEPLAVEEKVGPFYIDIFEHPNQKGGFPETNMTWAQADAACKAEGKRLCTAVEWERACKGQESSIYSYGDSFDAKICGEDVPSDADRDNHLDLASGAKDGCKSGWGVYDMSGGAAEWTSSPGSSNPAFMVVKGGKQGQAPSATRCAWSAEQGPTLAARLTGFRCCQDAQ